MVLEAVDETYVVVDHEVPPFVETSTLREGLPETVPKVATE